MVPPRPRSWEDFCQRLEVLEKRVVSLADGQLQLCDQIGKLAAEVARLQRPERPSVYDFDVELDTMRETLLSRVKDPRDRMTSERARAIAGEAVELARVSGKAAAYDAWRTTSVRIAVGVAIGLAVAMAAAHFGLHP